MVLYKEKRKGAALATVLIVFAVLAILGTTMLSVSLTETKQVVRQENNMQAYYAARSGADAMASYIIDNPSQVNNIITKTSSIPGKGSFNGVDFEVKVMNGASSGGVVIQSTGRAKGMAAAQVSLTLTRTSGTVFQNTIFTDGPMDLRNNTTVIGDLGTNTDNDIDFGNNKSKLNGNLILVPDAVKDASGKFIGVDYGHINGMVDKQTAVKEFPAIDESKFTESVADIKDSTTFNVEGQKRYIKVNKIDLNGNSIVSVMGKGELHVLITGSMSMGGKSTIQPGNGAKLFLYYKGTENMNIKGNSGFEGVIYAPNAAVNWTGGGNEIIKGAIVAKAFTAASSNTQIIYEPNLMNMEYPLTGAIGYKRSQWSK